MLNTVISLVVTILVFGFLIFIHEFGHYLVARSFGVGVIEFAIGMGPKIKTWKGKYNDFTLRALPIGGFINMVGEYDEEIPEEHRHKPRLNSKPVWQRMLIVLAGPLMNILLAYVVMIGIVASESVIASTTVAEFRESSVSAQSGLQAGDEIIEVNGKKIHCYTDMSYKILSDGVEPVDMVVLRNGSEVELKGVNFGIENDGGITYGAIDFLVYTKEKSVGNVLSESFWQSCSTVYMTVDSIVDTFKGRYGMDAVGGPIAVGGQISDTIEESAGFGDAVLNIATLLVFISVSLGICNLLPLPVLDGGRFLFYLIEAVRGKPLNQKFEQIVSAIFTVILFGLMILIAFKDLAGLF